MANKRLVIGIIFACLAPSPAKSFAEVIEHEKNILAGARWDNRWHTRTPLDWTPETLQTILGRAGTIHFKERTDA